MIGRAKPSNGHTIAECILAFAILLPLAALVSKIGLQAKQSLQESVLTAHVNRDLINAREEIGAWRFDDVTVANIQSLPHNEAPDAQDGPREWLTIVEEVQVPVPAKRVNLSLLWRPPRSSSSHEVGPLTFWVRKP